MVAFGVGILRMLGMACDSDLFTSSVVLWELAVSETSGK